MQKKESLSLKIAVAIALAMPIATSAFADSRHMQATRGWSGHSYGRAAAMPRSGRSASTFAPRGRMTIPSPRFGSRALPQRFASRPATAWRGRAPVRDGRSLGFRGNAFFHSGRPFIGQGRIRRIVPFRGGYRVFLDGWPYPYFIPFDRWRLHRFRVGLFIRFGAFYNPLGFYSVYDVGWPRYGYASPAYSYAPARYYDDGATYTAGELHGTVESVDFRNGTLVIHDDISGAFVTVTMPRDRRLDDVRAGDYVDFSGGWTRRGVFEAHRLERFEQRQ